MPKAQKLKRVLTVANIQSQKIEKIQFTGEMLEAFGNPQNRGVWFVWGGSGSGKSAFLMKLAKAFAKIDKTLYNLLEEESDDSDYIDRTILFNMNEVQKHFHTQSYNYKELITYLDSRNSAKYIIIDSLPYFTNSFENYMALKKRYKNKVFVFSGHAEGKNPRTEFQKSIMYDAKMKIFVTGYLAVCKGRTIGANGGQFIIWEEGYQKLRGTQTQTS